MLTNITKTLPKYWPMGLAAAAAGSLFLSYLDGTTWLMSVLVACIAAATAFATIAAFSAIDARLLARIAGDAPVEWIASMNGVKIGTITDTQYAMMRRFAFGDGQLLVAQVLNMMAVALILAKAVLFGVPLAVFWLVVAVAVLEPGLLGQAIETWRSAEPAALVQGLRGAIPLVASVGVLAFGVAISAGHRFGFRNHYAEAIGNMIRRQCNTPAMGSIDLVKSDRATAIGHSLNTD